MTAFFPRDIVGIEENRTTGPERKEVQDYDFRRSSKKERCIYKN